MTRRPSHIAKKTSPASWLGDFIPLDYDEAVIYGPLFRHHAVEYGDHITHAFENRVTALRARLMVSFGKCIEVQVTVSDAFWRKALVFSFPPMRASEICSRIWDAITEARGRPNLDPVALARERLSHAPGPQSKDCEEWTDQPS